MKFDNATFNKIKRLHAKYGERLFGKIAQKLLLLGLIDGGWKGSEHSVEGTDLEIANSYLDLKLGIEAKTTKTDSVRIDSDNVKALKRSDSDGYSPVLATLHIERLDCWWRFKYLTKDSLRAESIPLSRMLTDRNSIPELENSASELFEVRIHQHYAKLLKVGKNEGYTYMTDLIEELEEQWAETPEKNKSSKNE